MSGNTSTRSAEARFSAHVVRSAPGVEIVEGACRDYDFPFHAHAEITLGRVVRGEEIYAYRGDREVVGEGGYYLTGSDVAHAGEARNGSSWQYQSVYVRADLAGEWGKVRGFACLGDSRQRRRLDRVFRQVLGSVADTELEESVIALLAEATGPSGAGPQGGVMPSALAEAARQRIRREFRQPISVAGLAGTLGVRPGTLIGHYQRAFGLTPGACLRSVRMREAQRLLREGLAPGLAAADAGYFDQSHFHRYFKRVMGLTPGQYQKVWRQRSA